MKKLITDEEVQRLCGRWIFAYTAPEAFVELLYGIGFLGIREGQSVVYRSSGVRSPTPPAINPKTRLVIHPSYAEALNLQDAVIAGMSEGQELRHAGLVTELPGALNLTEYSDRLTNVETQLKSLPLGVSTAAEFEDLVGDVIKLCFFSVLTNVQPKERDVDGRVVRDWVAANRAVSGFWEMVRQRYQATQVVWECKNFADLDADAFHQAAYYMTKEIGRFAVLCFRGDVKKHYYQHIRRIAHEKEGGVVLLLSDKDLLVFIRQARNGKAKEDHIRDLYDNTVRAIS
jgi:hypothetical protein